MSASTERGWTDIAGLVDGAQRWGIAAVGQVADHVSRLAGATPSGDPLDVEQAFEAAVDVARRLLRDATAAATPRTETVPPVAVSVAPGHDTVATVWAHNTTATASPPLRLHLTPPIDADGQVLDATVRSIDDGAVVVASGASHPFRFAIACAADAPIGTFHAIALAAGVPELAVLVTITVGAHG